MARPDICKEPWGHFLPECLDNTASGDLTINFLGQKPGEKIINHKMQAIQECFPRNSVPSSEPIMTILAGWDDWSGYIELGRKIQCPHRHVGAPKYQEAWQSMVCRDDCTNRRMHSHSSDEATLFGAWATPFGGYWAHDKQVRCLGSDPCSIYPPPAQFFAAAMNCGGGHGGNMWTNW
jgi:hypothetical protein